ncbi:MAG TPA: carbohydrate porin [Telluria sp.]|nr:carbohydrate porin [Telluria sp.]
MFSRRRTLFLILILSLGAGGSMAGEQEQEEFNAKFQATYIWQVKPAFGAEYSGPNSLSPEREKSYSLTATAALGWRPWAGSELYFDPEMAQGVPLSHLAGLGGMSNGEMARTSGANPTFYRARLFLRQTWGFGGGQEALESAANQLAGMADKRRLTLTAGNVSVLDLFDANAYNHDPRTQFMNWSVMTYGAYDFAADSRGYTWGAALEYVDDGWAVRAGRFVQPRESNGLVLDPKIFRRFGDQLEFEHAHQFGELAGKVRLLIFRNVATMGSYADALALGSATGSTPSMDDVRTRHAKVGYGINAEQALTADIGLFGRASRADGKTETYAFAEIDRSVSGGALVHGTAWARPEDTAGLALARNGLSQVHRDYLAAGGLGFFVGDGRLSYRPEAIAEFFYNYAIGKSAHLGVNFQRIENPAYNHARGPVSIGSLRLHADF